MRHELKIDPEYFLEILKKKKTFEVRLDDREYKEGDQLILKEYLKSEDKYTGRELSRTVTYILKGGHFGIKHNYVVLAIQ